MQWLFNLYGKVFGSKKTNPNPKPLPPVSDTARSVAIGRVIEVLCSGGRYGIEGLINRSDIRESIFLDDTPLRKDGINFFNGITVYERRGTSFQSPLEGFNNELISESQVGATVKNGLPMTRSFINQNVSSIKIRISVIINKNVLDGNGSVVQVTGDTLSFKVYIKEGNGGFVDRGTISVNGKYSEAYELSYTFPVNNFQTEDEFFIKLERVTPADTANERRALNWMSYSEVTSGILPFSRMAVVGISFDTDEFGSTFPERRYHLAGQYLDIPTNATEQADRGLAYSGTWNGLFKQSNKAVADFFAVLWYLLTDDIDGVGNEIKPHMIDRYGLYEISKYNNEIIPDGKGGTERRFLCNLIINKRVDGWKMIDSILSACNARRFWESGTLRFSQDRPDSIFGLICNADITGEFDYSSTDIDERSTAVAVTWVDNDNFGKTRIEYVTDPILIGKYGYNLKEVEATGCTRRSQAQRFGRSIIYSENEETEICTFKGRQRLAHIPIGKIIAIADFHKSKDRLGGFVVGSSINTVELDFPVTITNSYGFDEFFYLMVYPDVREAVRVGAFVNGYDHYVKYGQREGRTTNGYLLVVQVPNNDIVIRHVTNSPGVYTTLVVSENYFYLPKQFCTWVLFTPQYKHKLWRVLAKEPDQDNLDLIQITCNEYSQFKWEKIERKIEIEELNIVTGVPSVPAPNTITVTHLVNNGLVNIQVSWNVPTGTVISRYIFSYKYSGSWIDIETIPNNYTISSVLPGIYQFRVAAISFANLTSNWFYSQEYFISSSNAVANSGNGYYTVSGL